jgi:2-polyprenyl-3-methyl-5-hydroxy-6-metoxy-1,4-benzoquinol methylase
MKTDKDFLQAELEMGIGFHNPSFVELCNSTAESIADMKGVKTILDYGGGTGVYTKAFLDKGYKVWYFDIWESHSKYAKENIPNLKVCRKALPEVDMLLLIEVAEHMSDTELWYLFNKQVQPEYILFSSTSNRTSSDEEWGHINIKEQSEWIEFFDKIGYKVYRDATLPTSWSKIFVRK